MRTPEQALSAAHQAWNAGDLDAYMTLYDERLRLHGLSPEPMDKPAAGAFYAAFIGAFDHPALEFHEVLWDGPACAIRFTLTGRHTGDFMEVPATGATVELHGLTILHFEGEHVLERYAQADMLGLLAQIGAVPAMA